MNPMEHVWDFIGRKINQCNPICQNIRALKLPIYEVFIILKDMTMTWQKWASKQALEKRSIDVKKYIDKNIGWCLTFV
jgi:hypothetical protein